MPQVSFVFIFPVLLKNNYYSGEIICSLQRYSQIGLQGKDWFVWITLNLSCILLTRFKVYRKCFHCLNTFAILICNRNRDHTCKSSFTTTLDMRQRDVAYGSKVGNTTNPQFLEVESWVTFSTLPFILIRCFLPYLIKW